MNRFYFTFGSDEQYPYQGGWVEVIAEDMPEAAQKFKTKYPCRTEGVLNCADYYNEEMFKRTDMRKSGNFGHKWHDVII